MAEDSNTVEQDKGRLKDEFQTASTAFSVVLPARVRSC